MIAFLICCQLLYAVIVSYDFTSYCRQCVPDAFTVDYYVPLTLLYLKWSIILESTFVF